MSRSVEVFKALRCLCSASSARSERDLRAVEVFKALRCLCSLECSPRSTLQALSRSIQGSPMPLQSAPAPRVRRVVHVEVFKALRCLCSSAMRRSTRCPSGRRSIQGSPMPLQSAHWRSSRGEPACRSIQGSPMPLQLADLTGVGRDDGNVEVFKALRCLCSRAPRSSGGSC